MKFSEVIFITLRLQTGSYNQERVPQSYPFLLPKLCWHQKCISCMLTSKNKEKSNQMQHLFNKTSFLSYSLYMFTQGSNFFNHHSNLKSTTYLGSGLLRFIHSSRRLTSGSVSLRQGNNTARGAKSVGRGAQRGLTGK